MQREKSATASAARMSDIFFNFLWQQLFTRSPVSMFSIAGALLVCSGVLLVIFLKPSPQPLPQPSPQPSPQQSVEGLSARTISGSSISGDFGSNAEPPCVKEVIRKHAFISKDWDSTAGGDETRGMVGAAQCELSPMHRAITNGSTRLQIDIESSEPNDSIRGNGTGATATRVGSYLGSGLVGMQQLLTSIRRGRGGRDQLLPTCSSHHGMSAGASSSKHFPHCEGEDEDGGSGGGGGGDDDDDDDEEEDHRRYCSDYDDDKGNGSYCNGDD